MCVAAFVTDVPVVARCLTTRSTGKNMNGTACSSGPDL